jgi:hypothetical protein
MPDQPEPLLQPGDIASFNATIVTSKGRPVGTCIKFRRFVGSDQMVHLRPAEGGRLMAALEEYCPIVIPQQLRCGPTREGCQSCLRAHFRRKKARS